ncbi:CrcB family protein [Bacillus sp. BGMRC 2118]|nr:CrcB family protein [Bacillus sp. BGMRC 2118]
MTFLAVCIGGIFGAIGRYIIGVITTKYLTNAYVSTLIVNGTGSFALGVFMNKYHSLPSLIFIMITVGLIGSFTTYSTFALDCVKFIHQKRWIACLYYISGTLSISIGLFGVGYWII